ncbi:hypothetical protein T08_14869 [Trichinella sp. T8]|nr:hypothetical protein T08_14869 [Trichinella sp. T8]
MSGMATDSDLGKPVIAKLNSLNYQLWKLKMKVLLMRDGLWDLVSQPKPCPISEDWSLKECKAIAAMSHGRRRPSYPFCATANCPGNVTNAIATRALGYAKILMILKKSPQYCDSFCGDRKCTVRSSNGIGQTEEQ